MSKRKILPLMATLIASTVMTVVPCFADSVTTVKLYQNYEPGNFICDEIENANLESGKITYIVNDKKDYLSISTINSIGLKELSNKEYIDDSNTVPIENKLYVLNNNLNDDCEHIPVYELTETKDDKNSFSMLGYLENNVVYVDDTAQSEMEQFYQTDFSLKTEDILENGNTYYTIDLPTEEDLGDAVKEGYTLKYWEYGYDEKNGAYAYFKAKILPTDESLVKTVNFYVLDKNGKYTLLKTEEVETGTSATAPEINGTWDRSFDKVSDDMDVYESKDGASSANKTTSEDKQVSGNAVTTSTDSDTPNPQTGDASNMFAYGSALTLALVGVIGLRAKSKSDTKA